MKYLFIRTFCRDKQLAGEVFKMYFWLTNLLPSNFSLAHCNFDSDVENLCGLLFFFLWCHFHNFFGHLSSPSLWKSSNHPNLQSFQWLNFMPWRFSAVTSEYQMIMDFHTKESECMTLEGRHNNKHKALSKKAAPYGKTPGCVWCPSNCYCVISAWLCHGSHQKLQIC